jgi:hypothetical protein
MEVLPHAHNLGALSRKQICHFAQITILRYFYILPHKRKKSSRCAQPLIQAQAHHFHAPWRPTPGPWVFAPKKAAQPRFMTSCSDVIRPI